MNPRRDAIAGWLFIVLVWSTTPLAIQWSAQGAGFLFSVMARMLIGALLFGVILAWRPQPALLTRAGLLAAFVSGFGIWSTMLLLYWGAQYVPSGLIAVLFGLSPLAAALWSQWLLPGDRITRFGIAGVLAGIGGLWMIFGSGEVLAQAAVPGIVAILAGMLIQNGVLVVLKRVGSGQPTLAITSGGVIFAALMYLPVWWLVGTPVPQDAPPRAVVSIIYLGIVGTVLGFLVYFWLLKHITAISLSLVTLVTPVTALFLGWWLNGERLPVEAWLGVALILAGLLLYQFGNWRAVSQMQK